MIVITAPTSRIGSQLLTRLTGFADIRVIVRDPSRLSADVRDRTEIVPGSHADPGTISAALDGADTVFWLVPPSSDAADVVDYYRRFTAPFCDALTSHQTVRVVSVTTLGRGYTGNAGHLTAALAMDEMIHDTGVAYRALRMPYFMENLLGQTDTIKNDGVLYLPNDIHLVLLTVATRDIADAAARTLLDEAWTGRDSIPVIGPDDLAPTEMATVISEVLERQVQVRHVSAEQYTQTMTGYGLSLGIARGLVDMAAAQDDGIYDTEAASASRAATSFRQWCLDTLRPAAAT